MKIVRLTDSQWEMLHGGLVGLRMPGARGDSFYKLPGIQGAVDAVKNAEDAPDEPTANRPDLDAATRRLVATTVVCDLWERKGRDLDAIRRQYPALVDLATKGGTLLLVEAYTDALAEMDEALKGEG